MDDLFDTAPTCDEDYLYFFAAPSGFSEVAMHGPNLPGADIAGEAAAELTWRLLDLQPGMSVLDLACGHGDLANRLVSDLRGRKPEHLAQQQRRPLRGWPARHW
jgi:hypothetical protein